MEIMAARKPLRKIYRVFKVCLIQEPGVCEDSLMDFIEEAITNYKKESRPNFDPEQVTVKRNYPKYDDIPAPQWTGLKQA